VEQKGREHEGLRFDKERIALEEGLRGIILEAMVTRDRERGQRGAERVHEVQERGIGSVSQNPRAAISTSTEHFAEKRISAANRFRAPSCTSADLAVRRTPWHSSSQSAAVGLFGQLESGKSRPFARASIGSGIISILQNVHNTFLYSLSSRYARRPNTFSRFTPPSGTMVILTCVHTWSSGG
jgi:hypothetical protein